MIDHPTAAMIAAAGIDVTLHPATLEALGQVADTADSRIGYAVAVAAVDSRWSVDPHVTTYIDTALRAVALGSDELALSCLRMACGAIQYLAVGSAPDDAA